MDQLKIKELSCVRCPQQEDYIPIKYCISCGNFEGSFSLEDDNCIDDTIPCSYNKEIQDEIINYLSCLPDKELEEALDKIFEHRG